MAVSLVSTGVQFPDSTIQTTAAGGGTVVFISSTILSSSTASVAFTGLSNSVYAYYILQFNGVYMSGGDILYIHFSSDNGASYITGGYNGSLMYSGAGVGQVNFVNGGPFYVCGVAQNLGTGVNNTGAGFLEIHNANASGNKVTFRTENGSDAYNPSFQIGGINLRDDVTFNAFKLQGGSTNIVRGRFYLYGVKNS